MAGYVSTYRIYLLDRYRIQVLFIWLELEYLLYVGTYILLYFIHISKTYTYIYFVYLCNVLDI